MAHRYEIWSLTLVGLGLGLAVGSYGAWRAVRKSLEVEEEER